MTDLAKSLKDLARAIERTPDLDAPKKPAPLTITSVPHRDADHRLTHVDIERSDGARFRRTYVRDEEHRVVSTTTKQLPPEERP